jgi:hypothetical protein
VKKVFEISGQFRPSALRRVRQVVESMVDLVGLEPTTSSMPCCSRAAGHWFSRTYKPEYWAETVCSVRFPANFRPKILTKGDGLHGRGPTLPISLGLASEA